MLLRGNQTISRTRAELRGAIPLLSLNEKRPFSCFSPVWTEKGNRREAKKSVSNRRAIVHTRAEIKELGKMLADERYICVNFSHNFYGNKSILLAGKFSTLPHGNKSTQNLRIFHIIPMATKTHRICEFFT